MRLARDSENNEIVKVRGTRMPADRPKNSLKLTTAQAGQSQGEPIVVREDSRVVPRRFRCEDRSSLIEELVGRSERLISEEVAADMQNGGKLADAAKLWVFSADTRKEHAVEQCASAGQEAETIEYLHAARDYLRAFECHAGLIASKTGEEAETVAAKMVKMMSLAAFSISIISDRTKKSTDLAWKEEVGTKEAEIRSELATRYFSLGRRNMKLGRHRRAEVCFGEARKNAEFAAIALRNNGDAKDARTLYEKSMTYLEWKIHATFLDKGVDAAEKEARRAVTFFFKRVLRREPRSESESDAHFQTIFARIMKMIAAERAEGTGDNAELVGSARERFVYAKTVFELLGESALSDRCSEALEDLVEIEIRTNASALAHDSALALAIARERGRREPVNPERDSGVHLARVYLRLIEHENNKLALTVMTFSDENMQGNKTGLDRSQWLIEQFSGNAMKSLELAMKHCAQEDRETIEVSELIARECFGRRNFNGALKALELKAWLLEGPNTDPKKIEGTGKLLLARIFLEDAEIHARKSEAYARGTRFAKSNADAEYEMLKRVMNQNPSDLNRISEQSNAMTELENKARENERYFQFEYRAHAEQLNGAMESLAQASASFQACREMRLAKETLARSLETSRRTMDAFKSLGQMAKAEKNQRFIEQAEKILSGWNSKP